MNRQLTLSEYVGQICDGLSAMPTDKDGNGCNITLTLGPDHTEYRNAIAAVLRNAFCGAGAFASDMLFHRAQQMTDAYQNTLRQHAAWAFEQHEKQKKAKPKREIQKAPKKGNIPKTKIEKAVKEVKGNLNAKTND